MYGQYIYVKLKKSLKYCIRMYGMVRPFLSVISTLVSVVNFCLVSVVKEELQDSHSSETLVLVKCAHFSLHLPNFG